METKESSGEFFFQDGVPGEQRERLALYAVGRKHQDFGFALKVGASDHSLDGLGEGDDAVVECEMDLAGLDGKIAHAKDTVGIEMHARELAIGGDRAERGVGGVVLG